MAGVRRSRRPTGTRAAVTLYSPSEVCNGWTMLQARCTKCGEWWEFPKSIAKHAPYPFVCIDCRVLQREETEAAREREA